MRVVPPHPGRPPLDPNDPSTTVHVRLPGREYDRLFAVAQLERTSVRKSFAARSPPTAATKTSTSDPKSPPSAPGAARQMISLGLRPFRWFGDQSIEINSRQTVDRNEKRVTAERCNPLRDLWLRGGEFVVGNTLVRAFARRGGIVTRKSLRDYDSLFRNAASLMALPLTPS